MFYDYYNVFKKEIIIVVSFYGTIFLANSLWIFQKLEFDLFVIIWNNQFLILISV